MLAVEEVIARALIQRGVDASAQIGHQLQAQIFIFQRDDAEGTLHPVLPIDLRNNFAGVGIAAGTLMHPIFGKHGQLLSGHGGIGREHPLFIRHKHLLHDGVPP